MNKKIKEKAIAITNEYKALQDEQRGGSSYNNTSWHAVDVKRYNDQVDIQDIVKELKIDKKYHDDILNIFNNDYVNDSWYHWIEIMQDQLKYEIDDIKGITEGSSDEHTSFEHITLLDHNNDYTNRTFIYFLGRSGGWCCFQDDSEDVYEDIMYCIDNPKESKEDGTIHDIDDNIATLTETVEEITYLLNYIEEFNNNISFKDEILELVNRHLEDLKYEEKELQENKETLTKDILSLTKQITTRINIHTKNKTLVKNIRGHAIALSLLLNNK